VRFECEIHFEVLKVPGFDVALVAESDFSKIKKIKFNFMT
jgi:hypothetical protein